MNINIGRENNIGQPLQIGFWSKLANLVPLSDLVQAATNKYFRYLGI